jgi:Ulp1 family protease
MSTGYYFLIFSCQIIIFDSLSASRNQAIKNLKEYLYFEAEDKLNIQINKEDICGFTAKTPKQPNHCDCGVYLLHFVEHFMTNPKCLETVLVMFD